MAHIRERLWCVVGCVLSLFCGLLFYLFFNQTAYISRLVLRFFPSLVFTHGQFISGRLYTLAISFGADFFWAAALPFAVQGIFLLYGRKRLLLLLCAAFGALVEIFQAMGIIRGTFDLWDIFVYFIGTVSAVGIVCFITKKGRVQI